VSRYSQIQAQCSSASFSHHSSKFNPLVDYRYHHLLGQLYLTEASSKISSFPLQPIVHNFFTTLQTLGSKIEDLERLLQAASSTLRVLFKAAHEDASAVAGKAEAWLETFGLMMGWLSKENLDSSVVHVDHLISVIGQELVVSLDIAQNRKKVSVARKILYPDTWSANKNSSSGHPITLITSSCSVVSLAQIPSSTGVLGRTYTGFTIFASSLAKRRHVGWLPSSHYLIPQRHIFRQQARIHASLPLPLGQITSAKSVHAFPTNRFLPELRSP